MLLGGICEECPYGVQATRYETLGPVLCSLCSADDSYVVEVIFTKRILIRTDIRPVLSIILAFFSYLLGLLMLWLAQ